MLIKNSSQRKIGLELEFLAVHLDSGKTIERPTTKAIWQDMADTYKHVQLYNDYATKQPTGVIYTQEDGGEVIINTDAGINVVEFGFLPFDTLEECQQNMNAILKEFLYVAKKHGVGLISYGLQPKTPYYYPDLKSEKIWYRGFTRLPYLDGGHSMFHNIAAHQPCIDVTYDEMIPVLNTFNAIAPMTIALFANSGVGEMRIKDNHEEREWRWDKWFTNFPEAQKISGIPKRPFNNFKEYLEYNWTILLPAVHRNKTIITIDDPIPQIIDYFQKKNWKAIDVGNTELTTVSPSMEDVNLSNMYIWIQARPKFYFDETQSFDEFMNVYHEGDLDSYARDHLTKLYIETRNIACQPWQDILAAPAFLLGLVENIHAAKRIADSQPWEYWRELRKRVYAQSLEVDEVVQYAQQLIDISEQGLKKRGRGEEKYIQVLRKRIAKRQSPAMKAIELFKEKGVDEFWKEFLIEL